MKKTAFVVTTLLTGFGLSFAAEQSAPTAPAAAAAPVAATIKVEKTAIGTAIENKEITGEAAQFDGSVTRVYCWTKVSTDQTPVTIKHVWSADGKKEAEVALDVKYPSARTWSSKSVWPGSWKVEVTDDQGKVLDSKAFTVNKEVAPPAAAAPAAPPAQPKQVGQ
jgi:hypothetical protein